MNDISQVHFSNCMILKDIFLYKINYFTKGGGLTTVIVMYMPFHKFVITSRFCCFFNITIDIQNNDKVNKKICSAGAFLRLSSCYIHIIFLY